MNRWRPMLALSVWTVLHSVPAQAAPFAYITNVFSNSISVIDTATNTVVATVSPVTFPVGVAVNPAGTRIYVANEAGSNTVSVIDTATNTVVATVPVGDNPCGVAINPAGTFVYVANESNIVPDNSVSVIDTATNTVVATVPVGANPCGVAINPAGTFVYVTNSSNLSGNSVSVIDTATNTVVATVPVGISPDGVAVHPAGTFVYVANQHTNNVSVIDTATNTVVATVPVGANPVGVAVHPAGSFVYVTNTLGNTVSVIDTATNTVVATVPVGGNPGGVAVHPAGTSFYVANFSSNSVSVIDTATNTVVATVPVGQGPSAFGQFIGPAPAECVAPPSGLVGWWPGDGNANNLMGVNGGILVGGTTFAPGMVGQAFSLNGNDAYVDVGNGASLQVSHGDFTVDAWVNLASVCQGSVSFCDNSIADKMSGDINTDGWRLLKQVDNHFWFCFGGGVNRCGDPAFTLFSTTRAVPGDWFFVAAVKTSTSFSLYVNGVLEDTRSPLPPFLDTNSGNLLIGSNAAYGARFNGLIDEVELYNRALSPTEIQAIFNAGSAGKCKVPIAPSANAGPDQAVNEGDPVTLDGSASTGQNLTFTWEQIAGPTATLTGSDTANPTFPAPPLAGGFGSQVLTFSLTVSNSGGSSSDIVDVTVRNVNHVPVAEAGGDQVVNEGVVVTLDGHFSFDPDGDSITYSWVQTGAGTPVAPAGADTATPNFTAPLIPGGVSGFEVLTFELTVSDGALSNTDTVKVTVEQVNHAPVADAGTPQTVHSGTLVTLNGSASQDPDGDPITFQWTQVGGPAVTLNNSTTANPSFTAPPVSGTTDLTFSLTVSDSQLTSDPADVVITVKNGPPLCNLARAVPSVLWPPNHKMVLIGISGVSDPDDASLTLAIQGVTQDELVNGLGDGDTSPDAVIQGDNVLLRAERSGNSNGRVYRVGFTADDGQGGTCTGSVEVGVPHSMKPGNSAVDDGQLYDSTQP